MKMPKLNRSGRFFVTLFAGYAILLLLIFGAKRGREASAARPQFDGTELNLRQVREEALHAAIHEAGSRCDDADCALNRRCGSRE